MTGVEEGKDRKALVYDHEGFIFRWEVGSHFINAYQVEAKRKGYDGAEYTQDTGQPAYQINLYDHTKGDYVIPLNRAAFEKSCRDWYAETMEGERG